MNNRIESLDSLRGISSLIVVVFHCLISYSLFYYATYQSEYPNKAVEFFTQSPLRILWAGNEAVLLFFMLSGFVLTLPFLYNRYSGYTEFAIKRIFRIYLPYIVIMLASALLVMVFVGQNDVQGLSPAFENRWTNDVSLLSIISYVLMLGYDTTNVNGVVWSLNHEMRISLIFPILVMFMLSMSWKKGLFYALAITSVIVVGLTFLTNNLQINILDLLIPSFRDTFYYMIFFILGITFARKKDDVVTTISSYSAVKKTLLFLTALLLINTRWVELFTDFKNRYVSDSLAAIGILIIFGLVLSSPKVEEFLVKKPLLFLGKISYSLYMVHIPVLMMIAILINGHAPLWIGFILVPFVSIFIAWLSYKYVELPAIELGRSVISLWRRKVSKKLVKSSSMK